MTSWKTPPSTGKSHEDAVKKVARAQLSGKAGQRGAGRNGEKDHAERHGDDDHAQAPAEVLTHHEGFEHVTAPLPGGYDIMRVISFLARRGIPSTISEALPAQGRISGSWANGLTFIAMCIWAKGAADFAPTKADENSPNLRKTIDLRFDAIPFRVVRVIRGYIRSDWPGSGDSYCTLCLFPRPDLRQMQEHGHRLLHPLDGNELPPAVEVDPAGKQVRCP